MKVAVNSDLATLYTSDPQMMLNVASFIDPRFRALSFLPEEEKLADISKLYSWPLSVQIILGSESQIKDRYLAIL